ncbi:MAG: hypothetical protein KJP16_01280 [Gammaproteobacteria bacterium]|nr:hypothetical protein [Gammaproteobacteria bacterium]NNL49421.1 hypothetical protein [Woeseiaceae bacterium]
MMRNTMNRWCAPDGRPDFDKMMKFMARDERARKFDAAGWALFFIWVGIAWLTEASIAVGLLGVAAITLGMQAIRKIYGVRVEGFWVLVGLGFAIAGFWQWLDLGQPLAPILLIAVGIALFVWRVWPSSGHSNKT